MRAYAIDELGQPGTVTELPDPVAGEGEVVVRVHAASVNPWDSFVVGGAAKDFAEHRFPLVPGTDGAGVVAALGHGVTELAIGDEVILNTAEKPYIGAGTFAELVAVPATAVTRKPQSVSMEEAATLPQAGLTALAAIEALDLKPSDVIAVIGATGAVGSYFVQMAAKRGATVIALARPSNFDYARALGASDVVDHTGDPVAAIKNTHSAPLDALADFTGNATLVGGVSTLLKPGGVIATSAGRQIDAESYAARGITVRGANRLPLDRLSDLAREVESAGVQPPHIERVSLDQAADALDRVGKRHNRGKVVLTIA